MRPLLIKLIRLYQVAISPWLGGNCRFAPSCSQYAIHAIDTHGSAKGAAMALRRIGRCHPWNAGGYDPVPGRASEGTD